MPTIYDWPASVQPNRSMFYAGGQAVDGGFTVAGARIASPEPGGLAMLEATFSANGGRSNRGQARRVSWLLSKVGNQSVFRFRLSRSPQLVSAADLGLDPQLEVSGVSWDNGQPFDNGLNFMFMPIALAGAAALEGTTVLVLELAQYGEVLQFGHLIGHDSRTYHVDAIDYDGAGSATLTVSPPLRADIEIGDAFTFRPSMLCTVQDPAAFRSMFDAGGIVVPGSVTLLEAIL
jgi:hypothetical protein